MDFLIKHLWIRSLEPHTDAVISHVLGALLWSLGLFYGVYQTIQTLFPPN